MAIRLRTRSLSLDQVQLMGILNTTPDSFYDGGRYGSADRARARAVEMVEEGADIIDVGGEKAGPGSPVSVAEELNRVIPVIEAIQRELSVPISIDTLKPEVARQAVYAGAEIINNVGGFRQTEMQRVAAETGVAIIIVHVQGEPRVANPEPVYDDVVAEVQSYLAKRAQECVDAGISSDRVLIDPGPDFGKTVEQDISLLRSLKRLTTMAYPVVLAASRKKFVGDILTLDAPDRLEGSLAVLAWGVMQGIKVARVHDVRESRRVCTMVDAVLTPQGAAT